MTTGNSPVAFSAVCPHPRCFTAYAKLYKIVVLSLDFLPLLPIDYLCIPFLVVFQRLLQCLLCTSLWSASSSSLYMPSLQFLFVIPRVCYGLTSYSTSRWTHLPFANSSYCQACSGLSPPRYCPFGAN